MASVLVGSGCVAHQHTTGHPAPVPNPAPHRVDAREAEHIALDVAAQRGYRDPYVRDLKWKDKEFRWDVKTEGYVARKKSKLDLWIDGETGEILKLKDQADKRKQGHAGRHGASPPPAHPRQGHRHSHAGVQLVFDSALGVYLVVDRHDHFYTEGRFYRYAHDGWQISTHLDRGWHQVARPALPPGLAKKHKPDKGDHRADKGAHGNKGDHRGDKGDQRGDKGDQRGDKGDQRGNKADQRGNKGDQRGNKGDQRGDKGDQRGNKGDQRGNKGGQHGNKGDHRGDQADQHGNKGDHRG